MQSLTISRQASSPQRRSQAFPRRSIKVERMAVFEHSAASRDRPGWALARRAVRNCPVICVPIVVACAAPAIWRIANQPAIRKPADVGPDADRQARRPLTDGAPREVSLDHQPHGACFDFCDEALPALDRLLSWEVLQTTGKRRFFDLHELVVTLVGVGPGQHAIRSVRAVRPRLRRAPLPVTTSVSPNGTLRRGGDREADGRCPYRHRDLARSPLSLWRPRRDCRDRQSPVSQTDQQNSVITPCASQRPRSEQEWIFRRSTDSRRKWCSRCDNDR